MKVYLHTDSAGNLPNRVGINPGNKLGHVRYLREHGKHTRISSGMTALGSLPHRAQPSQPCKMVGQLQEVQLHATVCPA